MMFKIAKNWKFWRKHCKMRGKKKKKSWVN